MKYSIDTSAILDARLRMYPADIFPAMWKRIEDLIASNQLKATEEVLRELEKKDDEAYVWALNNSSMFVPIDEEIQVVVSIILSKYERLVGAGKSRSFADPFVISLAFQNSCTLITAEKATGNLNKPKIPDVCLDLGIRVITLLDLFREQNWMF